MCAITLAQSRECPAGLLDALANLADVCAEQDSGTLCLGSSTVSPVFRGPPTNPLRLERPGDAIPLDDIDWLSVSSEDNTWGVARAVFPAYPYDGLEAEPTALLALGNTALFFHRQKPRPSPLVDAAVIAARGAYLRAEPSTEADIVKPVAVRTTVKAIAASPNRNWLRVYAQPDMLGWMSREVLSDIGDHLPIFAAEADPAPIWLPWQSLDFRSGIDDAPCPASPESGLLLQTPRFISPRQFSINGIRLRLSGAAWLQTTVNSGAHIHVLDGLAYVRAAGVEREVNSGFKTSVALEIAADGALNPTDPPSEPRAYDYHALLSLPVDGLIYPGRVRLAVYAVAQPAPPGASPLEGLSDNDDCAIAAGLDGANLRSRPDPAASLIAVMANRDSAKPIARSIGADQLPWWKLADSVWVRINVTSFAGDCAAIPLLPADA